MIFFLFSELIFARIGEQIETFLKLSWRIRRLICIPPVPIDPAERFLGINELEWENLNPLHLYIDVHVNRVGILRLCFNFKGQINETHTHKIKNPSLKHFYII